MRRLSIFMMLTVFLPCLLSAGAYINIGSIRGESRHQRHRGWIDVQGFDHGQSSWKVGMRQPRYTPRGTGNAGSGFLTFTREVHSASPDLYLACANGTHIAEITLELETSERGENKLLVYTLSDVTITSARLENPRGRKNLPVEEVKLNYGRINWKIVESEARPSVPLRMRSLRMRSRRG